MLDVLILCMLLVGFASITNSLDVDDRSEFATPSGPSCKATIHSAEWPSDNEWAELNRLVEGRLLKPFPAAAPCHRGSAVYDAQNCEVIKKNWNSSEFHAHHPTSTLWTNVNGYSCVPDATSPCTGRGFPVYVLNATSAQHIGLAVKWAQQRNVRVNIKSTGHDFLGRSTQPNSLSIWMHYMQDRLYHPNGFRPEGCNFTIPEVAVTVGGGTQMSKLTAFANKFGRYVVSGSSNTVSVGGYVTGGGHGIFSGKHGLAADNVFQVEMVVASGDVIVANECQNTDLFWAIRGGGGGTFGVVTKFTLQTFQAHSWTTWYGRLTGVPGSDELWNAITALHSSWARHLSPLGCAGYITGSPYGTGKLSVTVNLPSGKTKQDMNNVMHQISEDVLQASGIGRVNFTGSSYVHEVPAIIASASLRAVDGPNLTSAAEKSFPGSGENKLITSWLYGYAELTSPRLKFVLQSSHDVNSLMWQDMTGGPGVARPPHIRGGGNAVNPGWRLALGRPATEINWNGTDKHKLEQRKRDVIRMGRVLKQLAPDMGTYCNEADPEMDDIQSAFWGANYPRLLSIKKKWDPTSVFWCKSCVGSELWKETEAGDLCRR